MNRYAVLFAGLVSLVPSSAIAEVLLSESGEFGPEPSSEIRKFAVDVQRTAKTLIVLNTTVKLTQGKVTVRITDPDGKRLAANGMSGSMRIARLTPEAKRESIKFYNAHAQEHAELSGDLSAAWSKLEGAARFGLVIHFARWATKEWRESSIRDFEILRELELQKLDRLKREAWAAWEYSQKPSQQSVVV